MSRLRQGNGDDYPDAAGKHMEDSNVLIAGSRYDGGAYLAGYVVECSLKTLIQRLRLPGDSSINTGMEWAGRVEARAPTRFLWWTLHRTRAAAVAALLPCRSRKRGTA